MLSVAYAPCFTSHGVILSFLGDQRTVSGQTGDGCVTSRQHLLKGNVKVEHPSGVAVGIGNGDAKRRGGQGTDVLAIVLRAWKTTGYFSSG